MGVENRSNSVYKLILAMLNRGHSEHTIVSILTDRDECFLADSVFEHAKTTKRTKAADWLFRFGIAKAMKKISESSFDIEESVAPDKPQKGIDELRRIAEETAKAQALIRPVGFSSSPVSWEDELELIYRGSLKPPLVKPSYSNLRLILANSCDTPDFLNLNKFANSALYTCDTPWGAAFGQPRSSENEDALMIKSWIQDRFEVEAAVGKINEVLDTTALQNQYHPVKDYLGSLKWDGKPRIAGAFRHYLGSDMVEPYLSEVSRCFFVGAVKRIYEPGCQFDYTVVLEGDQGIGKSSFGRILASEEWFLDHLPPFHDKDAALYLLGTWLCELSELASINRSDNQSAKAFLSRRTDKIRPPFGRRRMEYPRSNVFIGTTNFRDYLNDPTGNRRYWPVEVSQLLFKELTADRDQLWAEAVAVYKAAPIKLYLEGRALSQSLSIQESRRVDDESDVMKERLEEFLNSEEAYLLEQPFSIGQLFQQGPWSIFKCNGYSMKIGGNILRALGYEKHRTKTQNTWVKK
jgi:hypothetical protein